MTKSSNASRSALGVLLALAAVACGRTALDSPVYATGDPSTAGIAGTFGAAGAAGSVGTAGTAGTAGNTGTAGATPATCIEGTTRCASHEGQQTCQGGRWTAAKACEFVCVGDRCGKNVRHVFATSQAFVAGELGGLSGADDICRRLAVNAGLSSSYATWLSDHTGSPASRFPRNVGPYLLLDGTIVANNWTDLTSGTLRHPIDLNELGGRPAQIVHSVTPKGVWTCTTASGTLSTILPGGGSCNDWSDSMGTAVVFGSFAPSDASTKAWSELGGESSFPGVSPTVCAASAALYCFEQ